MDGGAGTGAVGVVANDARAATVALAGGLTEEDTLFAGAGGSATLNVGGGGRRTDDTTAATRLAREDSLVRRYTRIVDSLRAKAACGLDARMRALVQIDGSLAWLIDPDGLDP